ncbi:MAG: glycosyltransferase family 2 protein [bacterium]|nr:glycosyltransferase family 2 protein [bacterium]
MKVSVIIPTYNEEKVIVNCLLSLLDQSYKDFEIILVDDGSRDKTLHLIKAFKEKNSRIKVLSQPHNGPGPARNLGASIATGEILVFVDSDMTFAPIFLEKLIAPIENNEATGTFSKDELVANNENIWSICWGINEGWKKGKRHTANYPDEQKVFRAVLKSEFDRVKGFDPIGYTDDWTLSDKLGYLAVAAAGAVFHHENPSTLDEVFKQAKWIGKREYKLGVLGKLIAMARSSLPISVVVGLWKSIVNINPSFLIFKIVYDFGVFLGALTSLFGGSSAK